MTLTIIVPGGSAPPTAADDVACAARAYEGEINEMGHGKVTFVIRDGTVVDIEFFNRKKRGFQFDLRRIGNGGR